MSERKGKSKPMERTKRTKATEAPNGYIDLKAAAKYLGMSRRWMFTNLEQLPHYRIPTGSTVRLKFKKSELDGYMRKNRAN